MASRPALWVEIGVNLALLVVLVSVLDAGVSFVVTRTVLVEMAGDAAEGAAETIAGELATTPEGEWGKVIFRHQRRRAGELAVYGSDGAVRIGEGEPGGSMVQSVFVTRQATTLTSDGAVRALVPVGTGRPLAVLELRVPRESLARPVWLVIVGHAAVTALVIALFGFVLFRRAVLQPVDRLREATARIASGEFGVTVSDEAPRELAELARSLSAMSEALKQYQERTAEQVTHLEEANERLRAAQEALVRSEKLAGIGRLAAGLAHELGNPLTAVRGYVDLLIEGGRPGDPDRALLLGAQGEVERMHGLLRSLLDYAREERHEVGPVPVRRLLEDAVAAVRHQPQFREVAFAVEADPAAVALLDAEKLRQALVNLLLNAGAAGAHRIALRLVESADGVVIEVEDDGQGITPEDLPRVFDPFFTTREPGAGTGLGLAIVHRIAELHGGGVTVRSLVGQGTTFRLTLDAATTLRVESS